MGMFYFLQHLNISMVIVGLIGFFGNMYEPGPVPKMMTVVAVVYLAAYVIARRMFALWLYERGVMNKYYKDFEYEEPETPRERKFQMYDIKESA